MASNKKQHISSNNYPQHNGHANSSSALATNGHGHTNGHNGLANGHGHHGVGLANGHSNGHTNGFASNGHSNGYNTNDRPELVAIPEMCSYCFDVLDCELNNHGRPVEPSFTNDS